MKPEADQRRGTNHRTVRHGRRLFDWSGELQRQGVANARYFFSQASTRRLKKLIGEAICTVKAEPFLLAGRQTWRSTNLGILAECGKVNAKWALTICSDLRVSRWFK